jgi:transposase InsO family protein
MTPQNYYACRSQRRRQEVDVGLVLELVKAERKQQPRLGVRKLYYLIAPELKAAGVKLGRDRLFVELGKVGLLVEKKPSEWPKTTSFDPNLPVFRNLLKGRKVTGRNQVWVADITYIRTAEGFMYLALITDYWSRKIVGYHLGDSLATENALKALAMAVKGLASGERPVHHSDRKGVGPIECHISAGCCQQSFGTSSLVGVGLAAVRDPRATNGAAASSWFRSRSPSPRPATAGRPCAERSPAASRHVLSQPAATTVRCRFAPS